MAIGRNFQESLQKALRSLETGADGFSEKLSLGAEDSAEEILRYQLRVPSADRIYYIGDAFRAGFSVAEVYGLSRIDPWFLTQIQELIQIEHQLLGISLDQIDKDQFYWLKRKGFSDSRLATLLKIKEEDVRRQRHILGVRPVYKRVDTCSAEFVTTTAYLYSTYDEECEAAPSKRDKIVVLGGGPNRIGQGIEFDYCCVHAALALREDGYETIMVNCNPETVSTDYDISDRLYFEPLTLEDVLEIIALEQPKGVIIQYGGQTPLKLARPLEAAGVSIIGTTPDSIDLAEDRERFQQFIIKLGLRQPPNRIARTQQGAIQLANEIGYPLVVRPSYVLGGRAMEIVYNEDELDRYMEKAVSASNDSPVLLDRFLDDAIEVDVDTLSDGERVLVGGIMEHIEQAGVHSGDSACALPPFSLSTEIQDKLRYQVYKIAQGLKVIGLMNTQFAIKGDEIYLLEVNPRASRTIPFVSKVTGIPLAKVAARCMIGLSLVNQGITKELIPTYYSVKEAVFPFIKFSGADPILGPEMKSTGEVMGTGYSFGEAFYKALLGAGVMLPKRGKIFISVRDADKQRIVPIAREFIKLGFELLATLGTSIALNQAG